METHANHLHKAPGKNFWHYFSLVSTMLLSSCLTPFHVGQDAETLPKHSMEISTELGSFRLNGGVRYGFLNRLDGGLYYSVNVLANGKMISGDTKIRLIGSVKKHYVISTGTGFGSGVEYLYSWNETKPHYYSEDKWQDYGGASLDGYIPIYLSGYIAFPRLVLSLTYNPYLIYRFGFYDRFHPGSYYDHFNETPVYRNIGKPLIGQAISLRSTGKRISIYGVYNFQKYADSKTDLTYGFDLYGEIYLGLTYQLHLEKRMNVNPDQN